jgi:adenine-specific DNA-methyltransferase
MKQKLELTWVGKDQRHRLEPRVLLENAELSYTAQTRVTDADIFDNRLIFGDNLLALKALEQELAGKVKCIFIDPPYNTGSAFEHYNDGIEHSLWLSMMRDRLELLKTLLSEDGSIWITVDDSEAHYLKVICDEIFGRKNFVANVVWQKKYGGANDSKWISSNHDHILIYTKNKEIWRPNKLSKSEAVLSAYRNPDNDPRGPWRTTDYTSNKSAKERPKLYYSIINPNTGEEIFPKETSVWRFSKETHEENVRENLVWWGKQGTSKMPLRKKFLRENGFEEGVVPISLWLHEEVGHNRDARTEVLAFNPEDPFSTPKPEKLLKRILELATLPGDLVLDSFAGSGTTGAVAHKMGRRWVMIELGEHAHTHIIPRLQKVVDGTDQGGISQSVGWKGGGGFRYYHLAKSVLTKDKWDNWIINPNFNAALLSEAMCKIEGYTYSPSDVEYWNQGFCNENSFIFVTTQYLTLEQLEMISEDVGLERNLLIMGSSYSSGFEAFNNLTLKKIPQAVLDKCEYGRDDYSLKIENLPSVIASLEPEASVPSRRKNVNAGVPSLFGDA